MWHRLPGGPACGARTAPPGVRPGRESRCGGARSRRQAPAHLRWLAYLWLNEPGDVLRVTDAPRRLEGVEEVHGPYEAAARLHSIPSASGICSCWATATPSSAPFPW